MQIPTAAKPVRKEPPASPVLPLTRPVVAVALGALVAGGASLFLAGLATGLGLGGSWQMAARPQPAPPATESTTGGAVAAEPQRRLVVGDLAPLAPPPLPAPAPLGPDHLETVVAALPPLPARPAVPPRKPDAPPSAPAAMVASTTVEGPSVAGVVQPGEAPADMALDSLESIGAAMRYAVQTGAYSLPANADRQAEELRRLGYAPYTTGHVNSRGTALTIVYAGRYDSRETAESAADALHKAGIDSRLTALAD